MNFGLKNKNKYILSNLLEKNFNNEELGIEFKSYIDEECVVWFKAKEVAQILGYKNTEKAIKSHVSENHKIKFFLATSMKRTVAL